MNSKLIFFIVLIFLSLLILLTYNFFLNRPRSFFIPTIHTIKLPSPIDQYNARSFASNKTTVPSTNILIKKLYTSPIENSKKTIFCIILTQEKNLNTKAKVVYEAWGHKCDGHAFISLIPGQTNSEQRIEIKYNNQFNVLKPANFKVDKYQSLTSKIFHTITDVYKYNNGYDWYLKADDDSFIFIDNLRKFVANKSASDPVTYGYDFKVLVENGYHSGGGGYLLSKEAFQRLGSKLTNEYSFCGNTGIEDVDVARCLRRLKVLPKSSLDDYGRERFHLLSILDHYRGNYPQWLYSYASNPVQKVTYFFSILI